MHKNPIPSSAESMIIDGPRRRLFFGWVGATGRFRVVAVDGIWLATAAGFAGLILV